MQSCESGSCEPLPLHSGHDIGCRSSTLGSLPHIPWAVALSPLRWRCMTGNSGCVRKLRPFTLELVVLPDFGSVLSEYGTCWWRSTYFLSILIKQKLRELSLLVGKFLLLRSVASRIIDVWLFSYFLQNDKEFHYSSPRCHLLGVLFHNVIDPWILHELLLPLLRCWELLVWALLRALLASRLFLYFHFFPSASVLLDFWLIMAKDPQGIQLNEQPVKCFTPKLLLQSRKRVKCRKRKNIYSLLNTRYCVIALTSFNFHRCIVRVDLKCFTNAEQKG